MLATILFIASVLLILLLMHWGLLRWICWAFRLGEQGRRRARWLVGSAFALFWLSRLGEYGLHLDLLLPLAYLWMGFLSLGVLLLPLSLVPPWRRAKGWVATTLTLWILLFGISLFQGLRPPTIQAFALHHGSGGPAGETGPSLRIAQISDLHFQTTKSLEDLEGLIEEILAQKPDLVAITGDLYDGRVHQDPAFAATLARLRPRLGVYIVAGNHEHYHGIAHLRELARKAGFHLLLNDARPLEGPFWIAGLDDEQGQRQGGAGPDLDRALSGVPEGAEVILLRHRPLGTEEASRRGVRLQLSGHTHAGQYPPMSWLVSLTYRYPWGLYRVGGMDLYTSCGTGTWGPPLRLGSWAEIAVFDLSPGPVTGGSTG